MSGKKGAGGYQPQRLGKARKFQRMGYVRTRARIAQSPVGKGSEDI